MEGLGTILNRAVASSRLCYTSYGRAEDEFKWEEARGRKTVRVTNWPGKIMQGAKAVGGGREGKNILEILQRWTQLALVNTQIEGGGEGRTADYGDSQVESGNLRSGPELGGKMMSLSTLSLRHFCDKLVEGFSK